MASVVINALILLPLYPKHVTTTETPVSTETIGETRTDVVIEPSTTTLVSMVTSYKTVNSSPESASTVDTSLGIEFALSLNSSEITNYIPFPTFLNITLAEYNILPAANNVSVQNRWAKNLTLGCPTSYPFGIEIFKGSFSYGNISSARDSLDIFGSFMCTGFPPPHSYYFANDSSPVQFSIPFCGSCCRLIFNPNCNCDSTILSPLAIGRYTIVAGDEWGNLLLLHFSVLPDPGSVTIRNSNTEYGVNILNSTEYATGYANETDYTYFISVHYSAENGSWILDPNGFTMVTTNREILYAQPVPGESRILRNMTLTPGEETIGQVAFELPNGTIPMSIEYNDSRASIYTGTEQIPPVTSWLSYIQGFGVSFVSSNGQRASGLAGEAFSANLINPGEPGFYTGNEIPVTVTLTGTGQLIEIDSINASGGFQVASVSPIVPTTLESSKIFDLVLIAPASSYTGWVNFTVVTG
ncbi:MAG: hypothetical protein ACREBS_11250 [Nitrososphaerales archaeon]